MESVAWAHFRQIFELFIEQNLYLFFPHIMHLEDSFGQHIIFFSENMSRVRSVQRVWLIDVLVFVVFFVEKQKQTVVLFYIVLFLFLFI